MLVSSDAAFPVSIGGVGTEESVWESMVGGLAPRGDRTVTLGRRLGVFLTAWRAVMRRQTEREWIIYYRAMGMMVPINSHTANLPWYAVSVAFLFCSASSSSCFFFLDCEETKILIKGSKNQLLCFINFCWGASKFGQNGHLGAEVGK